VRAATDTHDAVAVETDNQTPPHEYPRSDTNMIELSDNSSDINRLHMPHESITAGTDSSTYSRTLEQQSDVDDEISEISDDSATEDEMNDDLEIDVTVDEADVYRPGNEDLDAVLAPDDTTAIHAFLHDARVISRAPRKRAGLELVLLPAR